MAEAVATKYQSTTTVSLKVDCCDPKVFSFPLILFKFGSKSPAVIVFILTLDKSSVEEEPQFCFLNRRRGKRLWGPNL